MLLRIYESNSWDHKSKYLVGQIELFWNSKQYIIIKVTFVAF